MIKRVDYMIIALFCFLAGFLLVSNLYSAKNYKTAVAPENNAVLALEVSKLTKSNAELREQVRKLTSDLDAYKNKAESGKQIVEKYDNDSNNLDLINGMASTSGQGILINVSKMNLAELVDLINAIKNIGSSMIAVNGQRLVISSNLNDFAYHDNYQIAVLGNSNLLKSALERKGGIFEQFKNENINIEAIELSKVDMPIGSPIQLINSKYIIK